MRNLKMSCFLQRLAGGTAFCYRRGLRISDESDHSNASYCHSPAADGFRVWWKKQSHFKNKKRSTTTHINAADSQPLLPAVSRSGWNKLLLSHFRNYTSSLEADIFLCDAVVLSVHVALTLSCFCFWINNLIEKNGFHFLRVIMSLMTITKH